ncbi:LysR family transcriptional regulator [Hyphomicrobium sp. CS1BSMeth3]|uniref:LysR family transcriptional regulator n=1 Tax=Hyphomicrobium sp. CS1BSMeth3 TaxID=1892844 RepID=UPI0009304659|nr:LysR family transcriptional regulator [Hyphomicrobium sp. CS1BSMeth3]
MDFVRLRTLRELSLRTTMAAVADALHLSPSAVSQQIAQLEDELQVELVERRGRGVLLTAAGKRLVAHVERITAVIEEAKTEMAQMRSVVAGELRVAAFPSVATVSIPKTIQLLERQHPHLVVVFSELEPIDGLAALRSWQVDLAVIDDLTLRGVLPVAGIETQKLGIDQLLVMLPKTHRLARKKSVSLVDLKDERWALDARGTYSDTIVEACMKAGFRPMINGNCNGFPAIAAMVASGCSVSVMPGLRVLSNRGDFRVAKLDPPIVRTIQVAYHEGAQRSPAISAFIETIKASSRHLAQ